MKRTRSEQKRYSDARMASVSNRTSKAMILCLALVQAMPSTAFTSIPIKPVVLGQQTLATPTHTHAKLNTNLYATSSTELSISSSKKSVKSRQFKLSHEEMMAYFEVYEEYKLLKKRISDLGLSEESLEIQSQFLNIPLQQLQAINVSGQEARQRLLVANIPLVKHTVKKVHQTRKASSFSREDLVQEGTIGLAKAIDKFDYTLGHRFSTYAVYWIKASITRFVQQTDEMIRVPEYMERAIRLIDNFVKDDEVLSSNSDLASIDMDEVAVSTGLSQSVVKEALKVKQRRLLNFARGEGYTYLEDYMMKGNRLQAEYVDPQSSNPEMNIDVLGQFLSMKEMEALSLRYGLMQEEEEAMASMSTSRDYEAEAENDLFGPQGILSAPTPMQAQSKSTKPVMKATITMQKGGRWGEAMSFKEVGEHMRVSAEYGRRLCSSALKKLQTAAEDGRLDPAMLF
ncbi:hypothetical protein CTEN210_08133 [Chaetoceros tenuissimus]|uniref:RNA polymerase sigma-70 region 2 domain-containing protein n=1 Tax=Chaetoceros tenuissimus TaxID=426638 RepID=A0AAD3CT03_9STRA|nr:hypothetical protein CTEN210_08133 [Chaetoceros tenuissimus]